MIALTLSLLLAHILGDFVFQPDHWVEEKQKKKHRSFFLYWHIAIHTLALLILLQFNLTYWKGILLILVSHFLIDLAKLHLEDRRMSNRLLFILDQLAHLIIILFVVYLYHPFGIDLEWIYRPASLFFIIAILTVTSVSAVIMKQVMSKWYLPEDKKDDSLPNAGKYIGLLERLLVFGFIVLQQWQAIGFLIAAKSILRFSDLSRSKDRKLTEYVLIGTLWSFGLAIITGLAYLYLVQGLK